MMQLDADCPQIATYYNENNRCWKEHIRVICITLVHKDYDQAIHKSQVR